MHQRDARYGKGAVGLSTYGFTGNRRSPYSIVDGACYRSASVFANDVSISSNAAERAAQVHRYNATLMDRRINVGGVIDVPSLPFLNGTYACVVALQDIPINAEVFVDYGQGYWDAYPSVVSLTKRSKIRNPPPLPLPVYSPNNNLYVVEPIIQNRVDAPSPAPPPGAIWNFPPIPGPPFVVVPPPAPPVARSAPARVQPHRASKASARGGTRRRSFK